MATEETAAHCAERVRKGNRPRFVASLFAPSERRRQLLALYAFDEELQAVRTAAREPMIAAMRFQWWRDAAERLPDYPLGHPVLAELSAAGLGDGLGAIVDARETAADEAEGLVVEKAAAICGGSPDADLAASVGRALASGDARMLGAARRHWSKVSRARQSELPAYLPATVVDMKHPVSPLRLYWRMLTMGVRNRF